MSNLQKPIQLVRRDRDLAILYDIASFLNKQADVHKALQEVLVRVTRMLRLTTGWVWLFSGQEDEAKLAASQALPPYLSEHSERMCGNCLCLDVFRQAQSHEGNSAANIDVLRCSRLKNAERESDPSSMGLRFHASVPIYAGEELLGVMNVASEDWRELYPHELQLLSIISNQIGLALQRARLSSEQARSAARLATIEERNRLAREIHDTLAQGLAATTLQLETADALVQTQTERARSAIQRALKLTRSNLEEARRSVMDLRAAPLQGRSLPEAVADLIDDIQEHSLSNFRILFSYAPFPGFPTLPAHLEMALYRVIQEALHNSEQHAQASNITLSLQVDEQQLCFIIEDDGRGFDPEMINQYVSQGHFGLTGMSERVKILGGCLTLESEPDSGTKITVKLPY